MMKLKDKIFIQLIKNQTGITTVTEYRFHPKRKWRFDFAIPELRIAIEKEGGVWSRGRHVRGQGYINDMEKYNAAVLYGWKLLRYTPDQLTKRKTIQEITLLINKIKNHG